MTIVLKPLRDRVWVKKDSPEAVTAGGIIIPDNCTDAPTTGEVVQAGKNSKEVKSGDKVLFPRYSGVNIKIEGQDFFLVPEKDILLSFSREQVTADTDSQ